MTLIRMASAKWLLVDQVSSTSATSAITGAPGDTVKYSAFGEIRAGEASTDYLYTSQRKEDYIKLYWYGSRWYDDALGRFIQPDSLVPDYFNPLDWDRYSYARNNPIRYNDPTGHWVETAFDIAFIAYDIYDIKANGLTWISGLSLAADVAGALLPVVTGAGLAVRAITHADDVVDAAKAADTIIDAVETADKADDIADVVSHGDDLADALSHADDLPDDALVCRGGICTADRFAEGSGVTLNPDGTLSGVSVNSASGTSFEELTTTIPNRQAGVTTVGDVRSNGGNVIRSPTAKNPYHATLSGITPLQAERLFTPTRINPYRLMPK